MYPKETDRVTRSFGTHAVSHVVSNTMSGFRHWLECDGEKGEHVGYTLIATLGPYVAVTAYYHGNLPTEAPLLVVEGVE